MTPISPSCATCSSSHIRDFIVCDCPYNIYRTVWHSFNFGSPHFSCMVSCVSHVCEYCTDYPLWFFLFLFTVSHWAHFRKFYLQTLNYYCRSVAWPHLSSLCGSLVLCVYVSCCSWSHTCPVVPEGSNCMSKVYCTTCIYVRTVYFVVVRAILVFECACHVCLTSVPVAHMHVRTTTLNPTYCYILKLCMCERVREVRGSVCFSF